jgi:hypothetical protein
MTYLTSISACLAHKVSKVLKQYMLWIWWINIISLFIDVKSFLRFKTFVNYFEVIWEIPRHFVPKTFRPWSSLNFWTAKQTDFTNWHYTDVCLNFNLDNSYFDQMVSENYPHELQLNKLQLNKTNSWNLSTSFLDLHILLSTTILFPRKIYDKRDEIDFCIVNYSHLDGDVPHAISYGVSQLIALEFVAT